MCILLVEDDPQLGRAIQSGLEQRDFASDCVQNAISALITAEIHGYACLVLDLELRGEDGLFMLCKLRGPKNFAAILIVTARDQILYQVLHVVSGAEEFIGKTFDLDELLIRICSATRLSHRHSRETIFHGDIKIGLPASVGRRQGEPVFLDSHKFSMPLRLFKQSGQNLSRAQLKEALYGWEEEIESNPIKVHVYHLRKKLGNRLTGIVHVVAYMIGRHPDGPSQ